MTLFEPFFKKIEAQRKLANRIVHPYYLELECDGLDCFQKPEIVQCIA